jgi:hypothetical protein
MLTVEIVGMPGGSADQGAERAADREPCRAAEDLAPNAQRGSFDRRAAIVLRLALI